MTYDPAIEEARRSPAYEATQLFRLDARQLATIFKKWFARGQDKWNFDLRHATCEWFVENFETIQDNWLPRTYPRVIQEEHSSSGALYYSSISFAIIAICAVVVSIFITHQKRNKPSIRYAQIEFLRILLLGLLVLACGALMMALEPTDGICVASVWLIYLGYTLELVPLIVKVTALNIIMKSALKMRRVVLKKKDLFGAVFGLTFLSVLFLIFWTVFDAPRREGEYVLTTETNKQSETVVVVNYYCDNGDQYWQLSAMIVIFVYLIVATVLAVQTRNVVQAFNESRTLAM